MKDNRPEMKSPARSTPAAINRREFLLQPLAAAALRAAPLHSQPNILFCISDDQSYPHAGAYGAKFLKTPSFDRVAREGVLFRNAFVSTPSCCPSRGSVLTGQDFYRLRDASMNHTVWSGGLTVYPDVLAGAGYSIGFTGKGWGPGNWRVSGRKSNPSGPEFNQIKLTPPARYISNIDYAANFQAFLKQRSSGTPFCFWAGFIEPHREYESGAGRKHGVSLKDVVVPGFLPDSEAVRGDIADYAFEIEWYDRQLGRMLKTLADKGELDNTIVVVTSDNGMPFPRAKGNLYDYGIRMPLAVRWGNKVKPGRVVEDFVSFTDFAPTFLEAAGLRLPSEITGRSLMPVLLAPQSGQIDRSRSSVVVGIERHFPGSRPNGEGYPSRAVRTADFLYIHNLFPDRNPVGDHPGPVWPKGDPVGGYGDTDGGPAKTYLWENRGKYPELFRLAFGKRPAEELYAVKADPYNLHNLAGEAKYAKIQQALADQLRSHLLKTQDPRETGRGNLLDAVMKRYPVLGSNE
jgi:N-sulfoglucosamine sulfohydrolase